MKLHGTNALDVSSGTLRAVDSAIFENRALDQVGETVPVRIQTQESVRQVLSVSEEGESVYGDAFEGTESREKGDPSGRELSEREYQDVKDGVAWIDRKGAVHYYFNRKLAGGDIGTDSESPTFGKMFNILRFLEHNGIEMKDTKQAVFKSFERVVSQASEMFGPEELSVEYFESEREMLSTVPGIVVTEHSCGTLSVRSANS